MKNIVKMAAIAFAVAGSTGATASVSQPQSSAVGVNANTCYYAYSILTPDAQYDVYDCYGNGDGSY